VKRREFIGSLIGTAVAWPLATHAQQQARKANFRIGIVAWGDCPTSDSPYLARLRELGYVAEKKLVVECRSAQHHYDALLPAARELVERKVDLIFAFSHPAGKAAREATAEIPIVMVASGDPVSAGLVASLAHPGGNVTGLTYYITELTAKRLELLRETLPGLSQVGVLNNPALSYLPFLTDAQAGAKFLGLQLQVVDVAEPNDLPGAFLRFAQQGAEAVFVLPDLVLSDEADQIAQLALAHRLPTLAWGTWFARAGCLITYSADYSGLEQRAAVYTDKILKGANPGDLPVEQPTTFELVINLKTAKALGITIPPSIMVRADEVIE
jgi:putative ABC transport system substrate-binding protein